MAEWLKAHAWKACIQQCIGGSNPFLSAKESRKMRDFAFKGQSNSFELVFKGEMTDVEDIGILLTVSPFGIIREADNPEPTQLIFKGEIRMS